MGLSVFPAASAGGGIKLVQRGVATVSGNVTITSVDITKSYVNSFSNGSSGAAPGTGSCSMGTSYNISNSASTARGPDGALGMGGGTWSGGTTTLLTAVNGAHLSNATTLVVTGPCYWEVVEMN
jgi:hypothetical protein